MNSSRDDVKASFHETEAGSFHLSDVLASCMDCINYNDTVTAEKVFSLQSWCMISYYFCTTVLGLQHSTAHPGLRMEYLRILHNRGIQNQLIEIDLLSPQAPHGWE